MLQCESVSDDGWQVFAPNGNLPGSPGAAFSAKNSQLLSMFFQTDRESSVWSDPMSLPVKLKCDAPSLQELRLGDGVEEPARSWFRQCNCAVVPDWKKSRT